MIAVLIVLAAVSGEAPAVLLERFSRTGSGSPAEGLFTHLAVSAIYGALFGTLIRPVLLRSRYAAMAGWLGGLLYAGALLVLAQTVLLPGADSPLLELPIWYWTMGHAVYGLVLGWFAGRKKGGSSGGGGQ